MSRWVQTLRRLGERGEEAVIVTMTVARGSTPREAGAKMLVTRDALHGTIGGGDVEFQAASLARELLAATGDRRVKRFSLGAELGQFCGGAAELLFERVAAGSEWVRVLAQWTDAGTSCVLVTPVEESGGENHLLASARECFGTLGDGARDAQAIDAARRLLESPERPPLLLAPAGAKPLLLEPVEPVDFTIVLFGAGHVGRALVRVLGPLHCGATWVDARAGEFPREVPDNIRVVLTGAPLAEVAAARTGSCFLVMTHSHAIDLDLVEAILRRDDFAFCGMIGSDTKRRTFLNALAKRGVPAAALAKFTCPIGIASLKGKDPGTIAVSVAAQLLELREQAAAARRGASGVDSA